VRRYGAPVTTRYVALLRGINVGKAHQLPMPALKELLEREGHENVRTHLRSGNVVLDSALAEEELAAGLEKAIAAEFGFGVPVVVRTGAELAEIVAADPFGPVATDRSRCSVTFLPAPPDPDLVAALPEADGGAYEIRGRELHLWLPEGLTNSPMGSWRWDRLLGVAGTNRNWNTVAKLAELAAPAPPV